MATESTLLFTEECFLIFTRERTFCKMRLKEGTFVRILLEKYFSRGQIVEVIYLSKSGEISKRRVKIIKIQGDSFQAFCFTRKAKRTFLIDNVLACVPVIQKERSVI